MRDSQGLADNRGVEPAAAASQLRDLIRDVCLRLIDPTVANLDECGRRLTETAPLFRQLQAGLPSGDRKRDAALREPLQGLRADLNRAAALLDGAASFHAGWLRLTESIVAGYTAGGAPAMPEARRTVWLEV